MMCLCCAGGTVHVRIGAFMCGGTAFSSIAICFRPKLVRMAPMGACWVNMFKKDCITCKHVLYFRQRTLSLQGGSLDAWFPLRGGGRRSGSGERLHRIEPKQGVQKDMFAHPSYFRMCNCTVHTLPLESAVPVAYRCPLTAIIASCAPVCIPP